MRQLRSQRGFSLMELLIAAVLVPIIAYAVFANFSSATRLWKTIQLSDWQEDIGIFYQKTEIDFLNAAQYASIPFLGEDSQVSFAAFIRTNPKLGGDQGVGEVTYRYDEAHHVLLKKERNVSDVFEDAKGLEKTVLINVRSCRLNFFGPDQFRQKFEWKEEWKDAKGKSPLAVRFQLAVENNGQVRELTPVFLIPIGDQ